MSLGLMKVIGWGQALRMMSLGLMKVIGWRDDEFRFNEGKEEEDLRRWWV
jgi:hypothetical protein